MSMHSDINYMVSNAIDRLFDKINDKYYDTPPSEIEKFLSIWDLGDAWREWWEESGDEYK